MKLALPFLIFCALAPSAGAQWVKIYESGDGSTTSMLVEDSDVFVGVVGGLFVTSDNGDYWTAIDANLPYNYGIEALTEMGETIIAGGGNGGAIFRYVKSDTGWVSYGDTIPGAYVLSLMSEGSKLFAGTFTDTYRSTDSGHSWKLLPSAPHYVEDFGIFDSDVLASVRDSGVYRSSDAGSSWNRFNTGLGRDSNFVSAFFEFGRTLLAGAGGDVFKYDRNDSSWIKLDSNLFPFAYIRDFIAVGPNLFMGTDGAGVWLSRDSGLSWDSVNTGLSYPSIGAICADAKYIFAGDYKGDIWRRPLADFNQSSIRTTSTLANEMWTFPNPASESLNVSFTLPHAGQTLILIYDETGNSVKSIVNGQRGAGANQAKVSLVDMPSGHYFVRLASGGDVITKELIVQH